MGLTSLVLFLAALAFVVIAGIVDKGWSIGYGELFNINIELAGAFGFWKSSLDALGHLSRTSA